MKLKKPLNNDRPTLGRTQTVEVSESHVVPRVILLIVVVIITVSALAYGLNSLLSVDAGIAEIEVSDSSMNCGDDFMLYYNLGAGETSAKSEQRSVKRLYSEASVNAYRLFNVDVEFEDCANLWYINRHVNQEITVDPALYNALSRLDASGTKYHFLGPIYETYFSLFMCENDYDTLSFDPFYNLHVEAFFAHVTSFINNPEEISLELLGENTIRLNVSPDYLSFAADNQISSFIDLFWMKNAFIADYIADTLIENGFTRGTLISHDGFIRHFDSSPKGSFSIGLSHREGNTISNAETLSFTEPASIVYLRDYPLSDKDANNYYVREDGAIRSPFIDTFNGMCKSSVPEIVGFSSEKSCSQIALNLAPLYISDIFDENGVLALKTLGITPHYFSAN